MNKLFERSISSKAKLLKTLPIILGIKCTKTDYGTSHTHMHDCTELWYVLRGEATHIIGNDTYFQKAGTCVLVPSFVQHDISVSDTLETPIIIAINVSDSALRERGYDYFSYYNKSIYFSGKILPVFQKFSGSKLTRVNDIMHKMSAEFSALPNASFDTLLSLYVDFLNLLGGEPCLVAPSASLLKRTEAILKSSDYIYNNAEKKITLKTLCEVAHMSQSRFCAYFTDITGVSPINYLNCVKAGNALMQFLTRGKSLSEITASTGAADKSHLCRTIKKYYGKTLSELKEIHQVEQQLHDLETRDRLSNLKYLHDFFSGESL